jgi:hypothetical protein
VLVARRQRLKQLNPATTPVEVAMTTPLCHLPIDCSPDDAVAYLHRHRIHQVPIARDDALVGVVSSSDLRQWALRNLESQVEALTSYVTCGR